MGKNKALGMGLAALIGNGNSLRRISIEPPANPDQGLHKYVSVDYLISGKYQPRKNFSEESLAELAQSIKENGIISPIITRLAKDNKYEIIAGERRWRAAKLAGLKQVPIILKKLIDQKSLEIAIIENVQREDLSPIEEARGIEKLSSEFNYSHEKIAEVLGKSRSHVTNILRLLKLPEEVQEMINQGKISMSHARALINCDGDVVELAKEIIAQNMSVRDIESYVRKNDSIKEKKPSRSIRGKRLNADKEQDLIELEQTISKNLGLEVEIEYDPARGGNILINFANLSQLDKVMKLLSNNII